VLKNAASKGLLWKLSKGDATTLAELSDPVAANSYALCIYDASAQPQPRLAAQAPAGSAWRASGTGYAYRSDSQAPDGLKSGKLKPGAAGKTLLLIKGRGDLLDLPALTALTAPLTVQLRRAGGGCWGATFSNPRKASATLFTGKSD
jgi:hypothetical protein